MAGLALLTTAGAAAPGAAQDWRPTSFFVQGGGGESVQVATLGLRWPWAWRGAALGGELSASTELFGSVWRAHARHNSGREDFYQLGLVPMLRYRFAEGRSPWFAEAGIGVSVTDKRFIARNKVFSTTGNFSSNLALGRSFGEQGGHEVSLHLQHTSNAGIRQPNPGINFVLLRYSAAF